MDERKQSKGMTPNGEELKPWINTTNSDIFFGFWILLNAILLAVETEFRNDYNDKHLGWLIADSIFNAIFIVEMMMRIYADRQRWFSDGWNLFDFLLVCIGVLDTWVLNFTNSDLDARMVTVLRVLRLMKLLRVLRVFQLFKELTLIVEGIASAMRAIVWGFVLLSITIFVCAILITRLVGRNPDADPFYHEHFGSLPRTAFTLLQFTFEFQGDLCRQTWQTGIGLTLFFILFTCFTSITMLNIISSIIVDAIVNLSSSMADDDDRNKADDGMERLKKLKVSLRNAVADADADADGQLDFAELKNREPLMSKTLKDAGLDGLGARELRAFLDSDGQSGTSEETLAMSLARCNKPPQTKQLLQLECRLVEMDLKVTKHLDGLLALITQQVDSSVHNARYQHEVAQSSQDFNHRDRMDEALSLLNQLVEVTKQGGLVCPTKRDIWYQEKNAQITPTLKHGEMTEGMVKELLPALQSELRAWCRHVELELERNFANIPGHCIV